MIRRLKISKTYVVFCLFAALLLIQGCATTSFKSRPDLALKKETRRVVLMPMDIQLSTLTAGGVLKPEAEWTTNAAKHVER